MKPHSCVLAFDDSPHSKDDLLRYSNPKDFQPQREVDLIGVVCRGVHLLHVSRNSIHVDGTDATEKILEHYHLSPFKREIRVIMVDSPTLAGFNPPNPFQIFQESGIPVLLIPSNVPSSTIGDVYSKVFPNRSEQIEYLQHLPPLETMVVQIEENPDISKRIAFHAIGIEPDQVRTFIQSLCKYSSIPEPLRLAHLIASQQKLD